MDISLLLVMVAAATMFWLGDWLMRHIGPPGNFPGMAALAGGLLFALANNVWILSGHAGLRFNGHIFYFVVLVFFATAGFAVHGPLSSQGRKAVIRYLVLVSTLVLAQNVLAAASAAAGTKPAANAAMTAWFIAGAFIGCLAVLRESKGRDPNWGQALACVVLTLFCIGGSYIIARAVGGLIGVQIPWPVAVVLMAFGLRSTGEMDDGSFPDDQSEFLSDMCLFTLAAMLPVTEVMG